MNVTNKFIEFLSIGIFTPFVYAFYSAITIVCTFLIGLPIAIGIYFIQLAMNLIFSYTQ